jgi:hypothetical protein
MPLQRFHHRDARHHRIAAMLAANSRSAFGNLMMYFAASRSVISGFRPGTVMGSKNR